jgi:hypothetical protein
MKFDIREALFNLKPRNPYYIVCPPLKVHSAGVLAMHRLCHMLNLAGYPAFLIIERKYLGKAGYPAQATHPALITPELTDEVVDLHYKHSLTPILVYPDSISGNPLKNGVVVRYLLNYAGLLGGEANFDNSDIIFSYGAQIAESTAFPDQVLNIPISDPDFFVPPESPSERSGRCYWAAKYKYFHNGEIGPEAEGAFEITRDRVDSLNKSELRDLFQRSELFLSYENTALAIEAALCGCPTAFVPNKHFQGIIASKEMGIDGIATNLSQAEIERAQKTVFKFRANYLNNLDKVEMQLEKFVSISQQKAQAVPYNKKIETRLVTVTVGNERELNRNWIEWLLKSEAGYRALAPGGMLKRLIKYFLIKVHLMEYASRTRVYLLGPD